MLRSLTDYLIALLELLEAEGRSAKRNAFALLSAIAVFALGILLMAGAAGFLVTGLYLGLATVMHPAWVAIICGAVLLIGGGIVLWLANERVD